MLRNFMNICSVICFSILLIGCNENEEKTINTTQGRIVNTIQEKNGLVYAVNEEKPFTGKYINTTAPKSINEKKKLSWYNNGRKQFEKHYKNGKRHGLDIGWYNSGQKQFERNYKDGKRHGLDIGWYDNGQKQYEEHYIDGKQHGLKLTWYKNGKLKEKKFLSTSKLDSCITGTAAIGTVCYDGTVYAGSSEANTPMYVTRCDAGMTWDGSSCTGVSSIMCWNDCNSKGYVNTTLVDGAYSDGQIYTAILITEDSNLIVAGTQQHIAAQYCAELILHSHSDWYLPAKNELNTISDNQAVIENFKNGFYWSSSEYDSNNSWRLRVNDGVQLYGNKKNPHAVRCARL